MKVMRPGGIWPMLLLLATACGGPAETLLPETTATPPGPTEGAVEEVVLDGEQATVTILTTNGADYFGAPDPLQGEWSFAAWVEVGDRSFLFDTGWSPDNVLSNAAILGIDLSAAEDLILSHNHPDHTGGLETLKTELSKRNPAALSRIHVADGIFDSRPGPHGGENNPMIALRQRLEALGSTFVVHDRPTEISPRVWVTGPVPRLHDERNYPTGPNAIVVRNGERLPDIIPESQSLVVLAAGGPIFVSGCGHAGLINTLDYARAEISDRDPQAAIGGFHLSNASAETVEWTSGKLAEARLGNFVGAHCTGFEAVFRIRELAGMEREHAVIGAIGTRFEAGSGIVPGNINR